MSLVVVLSYAVMAISMRGIIAFEEHSDDQKMLNSLISETSDPTAEHYKTLAYSANQSHSEKVAS